MKSAALAFIFFSFICLISGTAHALLSEYTCSDDGTGCEVTIPDSGCPIWVTQSITVPNHHTITGLTVPVNLGHTFRGDLILEIESPAGTVVRLADETCSDLSNIYGTYKDGAGHNCAANQWAPDGPGALADFIGEDSFGQWDIRVCDNWIGDTGILHDLTLSIASQEAALYLYEDQAKGGFAGMDVPYTMSVSNYTGADGSVAVAYSGNAWTVDGPAAVQVANGASVDFQVAVSIPADADLGDGDAVTVTASLSGYEDSAVLTTTASEWMSCELPPPPATGKWWGLGWDGECIWVSELVSRKNYAFEPFTCGLCEAKAQRICDPAACAPGGFQWVADMAYDSANDKMCQVAIGGNKVVFCWDPSDCSCGAVHTPDGNWGRYSERGLAYRAGDNTFFVGGWETDAITEFAPGGATVGGPQSVGDTIDRVAGLAYDPIANKVWAVNNSLANNIYPLEVNTASPWAIGAPVAPPGVTGLYALGGADYVNSEGVTTVAVLDMNAPAIFFYRVPDESSTTTTTPMTTTSTIVTTTTTVPTTTSTTTTTGSADDTVDDDTGADDSADDTEPDDDSADDDAVDDTSGDDSGDDASDDADDDLDDDADDAEDDDNGQTDDDNGGGCCGS